MHVPQRRGVQFVETGSSNITTKMDLVDVNGDGFPDWVREDDTGTGWHVILNVGGVLEPLSGNAEPRTWSMNGPIRKDHSDNTYDDLFDFDGDGLLDRVEFEGGSEWRIWKNGNNVPKPYLLTAMENGLGGKTFLRYGATSQCSSAVCDHTGDDDIQDLPFVNWVVTAIYKSDAQCAPDANPFNFAETCLGQGHALLSVFGYYDGRFDVTERAFRGFRLVKRLDADANLTETTFSQETESRGRVVNVNTYLSFTSRVRREYNQWSITTLGSHQQIWLLETGFLQYDGQEGSVGPLARYTHSDQPDQYGNITHSFTAGVFNTYQVDTYTEYATPQGSTSVYDKPKHSYSKRPGDAAPFAEQTFYYDGYTETGGGYGKVDKGNVDRVVSIAAQSSDNVDVSTTHDTYGNIATVTDARNHTVTTHYEQTFIHPDKITNHLGQYTSTQTNYLWGKPDSSDDINQRRTTYSYDTAGRLTCVYPPNPSSGSATCTVKYAYHYGGAGVLSSIDVDRTEPNDPADSNFLRSTSYFDALLRPRETRIKRMADTGTGPTMQTIVTDHVDYDKGGRVTKRYEPYLASSTPNTSAATAYEYQLNGAGSFPDPLGRVCRVTSPQGTVRRMTYNGNKHSTFNETNIETRVTLDPFEHVLTEEVITTGPTAYTTRTYAYDGAGRVISEIQNNTPATEVKHTYDRLGRKTQTVAPDSGTWSYVYDKAGNLITQDDPKANQHLEFCYDALNRVTLACPLPSDYDGVQQYNCSGSTQCSSEQIAYQYDTGLAGDTIPNATGHLVRVIDGSGTTYFKGWDNRGRLVSVTKSIAVDGFAPKATTTYSYDDADRVTGILYPDGEWVLTQYDASGQPVAVRGNNGSFPYVDSVVYDLFGRATLVDHSNGVDDKRTYYNAPGQAKHQHLATLQTVYGTTKYLDLSYTAYNARGQLTDVNDARDQIPSQLSNTATYAYDDLGRLMTVSNNPQINATYTHDPFGNITQKEARYYTYPSSKPHQMSAMRIGSSGTPTPVVHDGNGSRIDPYTTPTPSQTPIPRYEYDEWNRLKAIHVPTGGGSSTTVVYTYDYTGRRVSKKVSSVVTRYYSNLTETDGTNQYKTYYLGGARVASQRVANLTWEASIEHPAVQFASVGPGHIAVLLLLRRDVQLGSAFTLTLLTAALTLAPWKRKRVVGIVLRHGHVVGIIIAFSVATLPIPFIVRPAHATGCNDPPPTPTPPPAGTVSHYHVDHLGSRQVETNQSGAIVEQIRYKPYGELRGRWNSSATPTPIANPSPANRYEFTGYETEMNSGLYYAGARFYDPSGGMFLTHDPACQFANPYTYTNWDPINVTDPNGALADWIVGLIVAAVLIHAAAIASSIDAYVQTGNVGASFKAGAVSLAASHVLPGTSLGLQMLAPKTFGRADPTEYTLRVIPVFGSAYGAVRSFQSGSYASGVVGVAATVASAYGAYKLAGYYYAKWYGTTSASSTANGQTLTPSDVPMSAVRGHIGVEGDVQSYDQAISYLNQDPDTAQMISSLENGGQGDFVVRTNWLDDDSFDPVTNTVNWDPHSGLITTNGGVQSPALGLGHELAHAAGLRSLTSSLSLSPAGAYGNLEEYRVINFWEGPAAARLGEGIRYDHLGQVFRAQGPTTLY